MPVLVEGEEDDGALGGGFPRLVSGGGCGEGALGEARGGAVVHCTSGVGRDETDGMFSRTMFPCLYGKGVD